MKNLVLFICIFFSSFLWVFADSIEISVDKKTLNVWETFVINIENNIEWNDWVEFVSLWGIDNFDIFSRSQSIATQIINGESKSVKVLQLWVIAKEEWMFTLWPATYKVWDQIIESESVEIQVWTDVKTKTVLEDKNDNLWIKDSGENNFIDSKKLEISISKFSFFWISIVVFFLVFYYILTKFFQSNQQWSNWKKEVENTEENILQNDKFLEKLEKLSLEWEYLEKDEFYSQLNEIFREYFEYIWVENAFTKTLKELQNDNIPEKVFAMFEKSYYEEFNENIDSSAQRKQMIMNFMLYLK
jgi:hypothetical protein